MHEVTQVCVVVDGDRYDVALPSRRPVVEFLADLLVATERFGGEAHRWVVRPVGTPAIAPHASLDDAGVRDGAVLLLEEGGREAVRRDQVVDNLPAGIADVVAARGPAIDSPTVSRILMICAGVALVVPIFVAPISGPGGGVLSALLALILTLVAVLTYERQPVLAAVCVPAAIAHAASSAWASTDVAPPTTRLAFALLAGSVVALALSAVAKGLFRATLVAGGFFGLVAGTLAGIDALAGWSTVALGLAAIGAGLVVLAAAANLGYRFALIPDLDRASPTEADVVRRVELGRLLLWSFHATAAGLVALGAILVFSGDVPLAWTAAALAAAVLLIHTRVCTELGQLLPLVVGAALVSIAGTIEVVAPELGYLAVYLLAAVVSAGLLTASLLRPRLRPLTRRRLGKIEMLLALACPLALVLASGTVARVFDLGRGFGG